MKSGGVKSKGETLISEIGGGVKASGGEDNPLKGEEEEEMGDKGPQASTVKVLGKHAMR